MAFMDSRRASLWTLLICGWICCAHGGDRIVWEGEPATLKCAHEEEETDIFWTKLENGIWETVISRFHKRGNTVLPKTSPMKNTNINLSQDGSLIIQTASYPTTNGTFRYMGNGKQCDVNLSVYQKMQSLSIDAPDMVEENSDVSVTCEVKGGNPQPDIIWDIPESFEIIEEKYSVYQSKVTLTVTKDDNNKEIGCKASDPYETLIKKYRFNVKYKPIVHITTLGKKPFYTEGERETLVCSAEGNPKPEITWMHRGRPLIGETTGKDKKSSDLDGETVVHSITVKFDPNVRSYSCTATNTVGTAKAFLTPTVFNVAIVAVTATVGAVGLAVLIAGMWFCFAHCKPNLSQLSAVCRQRKQNRDNDVDSQGYQSQAEVARFFESRMMRHTGSIGDSQSCRFSDPSPAAVGGQDTHDSSEYLHARSTPASVAAGRNIGARPNLLEVEAEVHYMPMDGSAKLKTVRKETDDYSEYLHPRSTPVASGRDNGARPKQLEVEAEVHYLPMDGSAKLKTMRKETDDSNEYLHPRSTPTPAAAKWDNGARPKQFEVEADVHYLPMDGSARLKTSRKETEKRRAKQTKSRFLASVPTIVFKNKTFLDTYGSRASDIVLRDSFNSVVYANEPRTATESDEDVPEETDFDLSGIIDSLEFASQPARDTQLDRKRYERTGDLGPIGEPCRLPARTEYIYSPKSSYV